MECALSDLKRTAVQLRADNYRKASQINEKLRARKKNDPFFATLTSVDAQKCGISSSHSNTPYDYNRLGRGNPDIFVRASVIHTDVQDFIMASCPKDGDELKQLLLCVLEKIEPNSQGVWVSLLTTSEMPSLSRDFLKESVLTGALQLDGGWRVKSVSSKVLGGKQGTDSKILPMLTERRVVFDNGICTKTIIHLHYDGWYDNKTAPDEALFFLLIDRMIEQSPEHSFISVNCRAGVGRSGLVVVFFWLRKQIDAQLAAGVLPETISVNIPETIYALRRQRAGALGNPAQMTQVYDFLGDYYEPLLGR